MKTEGVKRRMISKVASEVRWQNVLIVPAVAMILSACAVNPSTGQPEFVSSVTSGARSIFDNPNACSNNDRNIGVLVGAGAGLLAGHFIGKSPIATMVGGLVGAGAGGLIGHEFDARRCALFKIAQANNLRLATAAITAGSLGIPSNQQRGKLGLDVELQNGQNEFEPGTSVLTPHAKTYLSQIARQYVSVSPTSPNPASPVAASAPVPLDHKVLIVGHSSGSSGTNPTEEAVLSQQRAKAVAKVFADQGVPASNLYYQGAGNTFPIASEDDSQGQAQNRRIQIVDVPTQSDLDHYLKARSPNPTFFHSTLTPTASPAVSTNSPSRPSVPSVPFGAAYDFGGSPVAGSGTPIDLGYPVTHSEFALIRSANAGQPLREGACLDATPHVATSVRNLATGAPLPVRDYLPGFYGAPWTATMNGNLIALLGVYVPRDASLPIPRPDVQIYRNYAGGNKKVSFSKKTTVNVYRGSKAVLYRVFVNGPAKCLDLVVPKGIRNGKGYLYYPRQSGIYAATGSFDLQQGAGS